MFSVTCTAPVNIAVVKYCKFSFHLFIWIDHCFVTTCVPRNIYGQSQFVPSLAFGLAFYTGLWGCSIFTRFFLQEFSRKATLAKNSIPCKTFCSTFCVKQDVTRNFASSYVPCANRMASFSWLPLKNSRIIEVGAPVVS